jgi:hypothetical protein
MIQTVTSVDCSLLLSQARQIIKAHCYFDTIKQSAVKGNNFISGCFGTKAPGKYILLAGTEATGDTLCAERYTIFITYIIFYIY